MTIQAMAHSASIQRVRHSTLQEGSHCHAPAASWSLPNTNSHGSHPGSLPGSPLNGMPTASHTMGSPVNSPSGMHSPHGEMTGSPSIKSSMRSFVEIHRLPAQGLQNEAEAFGTEEGDDEIPFDRRSSGVSAQARWKLVFYEGSPVRRVWTFVLGFLLMYTATIFPYRLCFIDFHVDGVIPDNIFWQVFEIVMDSLWWVDLVINFFFTYRQPGGTEVDDMRLIAKHYLQTYFFINLLACIPHELLEMTFSGGAASVNGVIRISRLQRLTRLARLVRLIRLGKYNPFSNNSATLLWLRSWRGTHILNFMVAFVWIVHMLSCGWYLVAALHEEPRITWIGRRGVGPTFDSQIDNLIDKGPGIQWLHAMYFILTVFTSVGFGDISAVTSGEMVYVGLVMLVGAVLHSMIVSEVISVITSIDTKQIELARRRGLISAFIKHTELNDGDTKFELQQWVDAQVHSGDANFDRDAVKQILLSSSVPPQLMKRLPLSIFGGRLLHQRFLSACLTQAQYLPPRFALLMALSVNRQSYHSGEIVYQMHEHPFNVFLVDEGVFAHVGKVSSYGGHDGAPKVRVAGASPWNADQAPPLHNLRKLVSRHSYHRVTRMSISSGHLHPYRLICRSSYFGDIEVLDPGPRRSTVRCESQQGHLFILNKREMYGLIEEFPHFGKAWRNYAKANERRRQAALRNLTYDATYKERAAIIIQQAWRERFLHEYDTFGAEGTESFMSSGIAELHKIPEEDRVSQYGATSLPMQGRISRNSSDYQVPVVKVGGVESFGATASIAEDPVFGTMFESDGGGMPLGATASGVARRSSTQSWMAALGAAHTGHSENGSLAEEVRDGFRMMQVEMRNLKAEIKALKTERRSSRRNSLAMDVQPLSTEDIQTVHQHEAGSPLIRNRSSQGSVAVPSASAPSPPFRSESGKRPPTPQTEPEKLRNLGHVQDHHHLPGSPVGEH
mmetsp:Transcript_12262/g.28627  ORF Transcript_12262/g.28627 Transcript_12262/m.28627 type:complete len:954 (-) Transcript_12262:98-2959(-)